MRRSPVIGAAALAAGVLASACSGPEAEGASGAAAVTVAWSSDRFSLQGTAPGVFDMRDAYWMARIAKLASIAPADARTELSKMGLGAAEYAFFTEKKTNTQAIYVGTSGAGILAYRGTEQPGDLITDLKIKKDTTFFGAVHHGFYEAFTSTWNDDGDTVVEGIARPHEGIRTFLARRHGGSSHRPLYLAGHSLGGALATIAFVHLRYEPCARRNPGRTAPLLLIGQYAGCAAEPREVDVHSVYTFGAPRPGDRRLGALAAGDGIWSTDRPFLHRFVNGVDLIPSLLSRLPGGFSHPSRGGDENQTLLYLPDAGPMVPHGPVGSSWRSDLGTRAAAHRCAAYIERILANIAPGEVAARPPPEAIEAIAREYASAPPSAFEPLDPARLAGDARATGDVLAAAGAPVEVFAWNHSAPLFEVRTSSTTSSGRTLRQSYFYDTAFALVGSVSQIEDPEVPDGVFTLVLGPDDLSAR